MSKRSWCDGPNHHLQRLINCPRIIIIIYLMLTFTWRCQELTLNAALQLSSSLYRAVIDWPISACLHQFYFSVQCLLSRTLKCKPIAGCKKWHAPHTHWNVNATNKLKYRRLNSLENLNCVILLYTFYCKHFIACIRLASFSCLTAITIWTPD